MPSNTDRLSLIKHTVADQFRIQDYRNNWERLDDFPGPFICTSSTRPTWGTRQQGMSIFETDTKLIWHWDGSAWERLVAKGFLNRVEVTSDETNATTTYTTAVSVPVTVADGNRWHRITAEASGVYNDQGLTELAIYRGSTLLQEWFEQGATGVNPIDRPRPVSMVTYDQPSSGAQTYTLQFRATTEFGGTSTIIAAADTPIALAVEEV